MKEAKSLAKIGMKVHLIARMKEGQVEREEINGILVRRIRLPFSEGGKLQAILYYSLTRHLIILSALKAIREFKPTIIHVHDLPPAISLYLLSRIFRIPMVLDLHEDWPDLIYLTARRDS
ncbi:MAG: glycosyltransferase, partial [Candidatus Korarchaeum sp.]|nr:glycosyltransferase [Candidatus Korarchaeum sp.]MDW8036349.1 glycosyltransferase [Candidatus Korarchaeum sp.]